MNFKSNRKMWNINKQKFLNFLILVSLFHGIRGEFGGIKEQRKIASGPQLENNFGETPGETVITTAITVDDEKFDDYELRKLFIEKFKWYENLERERNKNGTRETLLRRKIREADYVDPDKFKLECYSCFFKITKNRLDDICYKGATLPTEKCARTSQCYTELNPQYVRRGCGAPDRMNRTFVCKCPLCNDKRISNPVYYTYKKISDWEYDNKRLKKPSTGMELLCKICETKGTSRVADKICREGKDADSMVCEPNQLCYTNIDDDVGFVSRGCISTPVFNSIYLFCSEPRCNNDTFESPKLIDATAEELDEKSPTRSALKRMNARNFSGWIHCKNIFMIFLMLFFYIIL